MAAFNSNFMVQKKKTSLPKLYFLSSKRLGLLKFDCTFYISIVILERFVGRFLFFMPSPMSVIASKFIFSYYFLFIFISIYSPSSLDNGGGVILRASDYFDQLLEMPRIAKSTTINY